MSGTTLSTADLDPRRRRLLFRAWHRGTREMDLLMGQFADAVLPTMDESELDEFELLSGCPDGDLLKWLIGELATPPEYDFGVFKKLKAFHTHSAPLHK